MEIPPQLISVNLNLETTEFSPDQSELLHDIILVQCRFSSICFFFLLRIIGSNTCDFLVTINSNSERMTPSSDITRKENETKGEKDIHYAIT